MRNFQAEKQLKKSTAFEFVAVQAAVVLGGPIMPVVRCVDRK
jgi:hypothetical protein